jgi:transposase
MKPQTSIHNSAQTTAWQEATDDSSLLGEDAFIIAYASGTSLREAARTAGISESTAYRRLKDPAFRRRISEIRTSFLNQAVGLLCEDATKAVSTLKELLSARSESVRLSAARAILELGPKLREQTELEERITALEREAAGVDDEDEEPDDEEACETEEDEGEEVDDDDDEA